MKDESITAVGTGMSSYYGRPILKEPVWKPQIPLYLFTSSWAQPPRSSHRSCSSRTSDGPSVS